jgi:uncharacterized protein YecE (DUF72 family)
VNGETTNHPNFFSGLSGVVLPVPKYQFPDEFKSASRLTYYATFFNSIEINSSFYKIPMKTTVATWASSVPENFRFTFKLFREVTHVKELNFDDRHIEQFIETISHAGDKRGCLLVQFPPGLKNDSINQLDRLLNSIKLADTDDLWKVAVEFRSKGWYNEEVFDILKYFNCALVIHDIPKSATPRSNLPSDFVYVRFHGPTGNYRGSYSDAFLVEYSQYIKEWLQEGKTVYVYFNNTAGDAFNDLCRLNRFV